MPARSAPDPPPCIRRSGSRIPKFVAHSAPAYVVGTETTGRPVATETAFARSIVLPPPTASSPSAPSAAAASSSIRSLGTSLQRPAAGRSSSDQRSLAMRNGRSIPSSLRTLASSRRPQRASPPDARALLHQDRRFAAELFERDLLAGERVAGRDDEDHLVAEEGLEDDTAVARRRAHNPELELARGHLLDDAVRVGDRQRDTQLGVLALELAEQHRNDGAAGPGGSAERELAAQLAIVAGKLFEQLPLEGEH